MDNMKTLAELLPVRSQLLDPAGRPLTQSLFLEIGYTDSAVYTLKDYDHEYKGKLYPSLQRLYLLIEDPTEYTFATQCLLGWKHWQRICENKQLRVYVDEWRAELEVKIRSQGVLEALKQAHTGSFQAAKWVADKGWEQKAAGRPSKEELEKRAKIAEKVSDEYSADVLRLGNYK